MESVFARIERGTIIEASDGNEYKAQSLDRRGVVSGTLKALGDATYQTGDRVEYYTFPDGTGRIFCKM